MNNFENLDKRVESAVQKFHQSEELRRTENKSLSRILNDLEIKFEARTAELEDCTLRISELEESNVSLNALVCQLVDIVEKSADEIAGDPLYRASAAASDIVDRFVAEQPANDEVGPPAAPRKAPVAALEQGPPTAPASKSSAMGTFEDIEAEFLLAEELFEKTEGAAEFPKLVFDAVTMARGEEMPEAAAGTTSAPGEHDAQSLSDGDLDIKEIMARLEIAAERAQLRADDDARQDRAKVETEVLDRAVGGRV